MYTSSGYMLGWGWGGGELFGALCGGTGGGGEPGAFAFICFTGLQQVAAATAERDKTRSEYQNVMRESGQLQSQLEMSQSEVRMMRMALAEKESEVSRACDETLYVAGYPLLLQQD